MKRICGDLAVGEIEPDAQLEVSVGAALMLATRARDTLTRMQLARDADCVDIRRSLLDARERGTRPTGHAQRHVSGCVRCDSCLHDVRRGSRTARAARERGAGGPDRTLAMATPLEQLAAAA